MPDAGAARIDSPAPSTPASAHAQPYLHPWRTLLWKVLLAMLLLAAVLFGLPGTDRAFLFLLSTTLLLWGALFVGAAVAGLLVAPPAWAPAWVALAVGAYGALAVPPLATGDPTRMLEALGPVTALTLAAQLGRHDLAGALHDWAVLMGVALYAALGVGALWALLPFGPAIFAVAVLLPPVALEVALLLLRRVPSLREGLRQGLAVLAATLLSTVIISLTQYNTRMPAEWALFFSLAIGVLVGGALFLSLQTRSMFASDGYGPVRALVELTHGALLIGLATYIPIRLFAL